MEQCNRRQFLSACAATGPLAMGLAGAQPQSSAAPAAFPALAQRLNGQPLTYLDSAATTLRPRAVIDALVEFYSTDNANPSPVHQLASRAAERLAAARRTIATFIHAPDPSEIVFVRGTTEGVNLVASTWGCGQSARRRRDRPDGCRAQLQPDAVDAGGAHRGCDRSHRRCRRRGTARGSINSRRCYPHAPGWSRSVMSRTCSGSSIPRKRLCALARQAGAHVVIDGAQAAPHVAIDVQDLGCDFYVFSGHKMLGPMGTGVLWGRRELLDAMPPYHVGSNMAHEVDFEHAALEHGAQKFHAGTPDVAGPVGLAAAVTFLDRLGRDTLWTHDQDLVRHGLQRLATIPSTPSDRTDPS